MKRLLLGLGSVVVAVPLLSGARAVHGFLSGTAELMYADHPEASGFNLDPATRVPRRNRKCLVPMGEPLLVHLPNNLAVAMLGKLLGPMPGSYHGPYPTPQQSAALLEGAPSIRAPLMRSEWSPGIDCDGVRAQTHDLRDVAAGDESAAGCALFEGETMVLGNAAEARLFDRSTGRLYAVQRLPPPPQEWLGDLPLYPRASLVCRQHVVGAGPAAPHIEWSLYAITQPPAEVTAYYRARTGTPAARDGGPLTLTSADGATKLSVQPASAFHPDCGVRPPADAKSVLVVSTFIAPR